MLKYYIAVFFQSYDNLDKHFHSGIQLLLKTTEKLKVKFKNHIQEKMLMGVLTKFTLVIVWIMTFFLPFPTQIDADEIKKTSLSTPTFSFAKLSSLNHTTFYEGRVDNKN